MSDDRARRVARWLGNLLLGNLPGLFPLFLRVSALVGLAVASMLGAIHYAHLDDSGLPGRRGWMGLVVLSMCCFLRAVFELWERDRGLAASIAALAIFGSIAVAALGNVEPTDPMAMTWIGAAFLAAATTTWRLVVIAREG